ncbi:MAG: hypothetical protein ABSC25_05830 [Roseiarcus sp.]
MPFELGLFLGAHRFGGKKHSRKKSLIFDREGHRYQSFISDIAGQDIHSHDSSLGSLIEQISTWLLDQAQDYGIPGGRAIAAEFNRFRIDLPAIAAAKRLQPEELTFKDLTNIAAEWILAESGAG